MTSSEETNFPILPDRIFAVGDEPVGVRVTPYHKPCGIRRIINALDADEVAFMRRSPFGKFVEIADLPYFSGRFGRYIISRQLKVRKRHEAWFLFAGKPIRFSIREFAAVTGLNCSNFPPNSKKRSNRNIKEKPFWGELFGTLKDVHVATVIRMLERKTVTERATRIKYACLALLSSVILPTTHSHRISHDHAEKIKNIEEFFAFPWGRVAFELLMSSIKERNEISLSQNTIALKRFVLALQLVMIEAVPALTEVVRDGSSSGSEGDFGEDEELVEGVRRGISPAHARDIDTEAKAQVVSIVGSATGSNVNDSELYWSDEEEDTKVDNLIRLIEGRYDFSNQMFTGGASKVDVIRMWEEANVEAVVRKTKKQRTPIQVSDSLDPDYIAAVVKASMKEDMKRLEAEVGRLNESFSHFQSSFVANVEKMLETIKSDITTVTSEVIRSTLPGRSGYTRRHEEHHRDGVNENAPHGNGRSSLETETEEIINATINFSVLATNRNNGEGTVFEETEIHDAVLEGGDINLETDNAADEFDVPLQAFRKSKRPRVVPKALVRDYACDIRLLNQARVAHFANSTGRPNIDYGLKYSKLLEKLKVPLEITVGGTRIGNKEINQIVDRNCQLPAKTQVIDVLMHQTRSVYQSQSSQSQSVFLDTKFVSQLGKCSAKFSKTAKKDAYIFSATLCGYVQRESTAPVAERYYFPFNLDKTHWVGICVDTVNWSVVVLDCIITLRSESLMTKELKNIAVMFPYLLRQGGKPGCSKDTKPVHVDRPRSVPQNPAQAESALTAVLLIQAHAIAGVEVCKCITPDVLAAEAERLVVMMYEDNVATL
ncbi:hypothetical protein N665_0703s0012 [Sinapis alba]|nr:hypothetical protein N665_0703s0012 [Sinapis alba]